MAPLTIRTITLTLTYLHYYTCKFIPGRYLSLVHLRRLASWVQPGHKVSLTIRQEPYLAGCLTLAEAAGLIHHHTGFWMVTPDIYTWLKATPAAQIKQLLRPLINQAGWQQIVKQSGLHNTIPDHLAVYWQQQLLRQANPEPIEPQPVSWHKVTTEGWSLCLPETLAPYLWFHLNQLGEWQPGQPLYCSPLTIAQAVGKGYGLGMVRTLLRRATGQPLPEVAESVLAEWFGRVGEVQLRPVYLLTTRQADQLARILQNRRLRKHIQEVIGPRQAIARATITPSLQRWLTQQGVLLHTTKPLGAIDPYRTGQKPAPDHTWLALRVLSGIGELVPLPVPVPQVNETLASLALAEEQVSELEGLAQQIVEGMRQAIRGRDAFFPATEPTDTLLFTQLQMAITDGYDVEISYQSLVDKQPYPRRVSPLWLEEKGELLYLHAYCHLAEAERIFRLDRIHHCMPVQGNDSSL